MTNDLPPAVEGTVDAPAPVSSVVVPQEVIDTLVATWNGARWCQLHPHAEAVNRWVQPYLRERDA